MQIDPVLEWRRLAEEYRQKTPEELRELALDFADLTEAAQQALRSEMQSRGMGDPDSTRAASAPVTSPSQSRSPVEVQPSGVLGPRSTGVFVFGSEIPQLVPDDSETESDSEGPHDYTWKTPLCDCESSEEAAQLKEVLRRAGIESWVSFDGYTSSYVPSTEQRLTAGSLRILVAADQLDQARIIAAQPIPQEIVDELKEEVPEFIEPKCPKCGSDDVVLEGVDPANTWRCEQCDAQWTESMPADPDGAPDQAKTTS